MKYTYRSTSGRDVEGIHDWARKALLRHNLDSRTPMTSINGIKVDITAFLLRQIAREELAIEHAKKRVRKLRREIITRSKE
jgi:hypothetical protein